MDVVRDGAGLSSSDHHHHQAGGGRWEDEGAEDRFCWAVVGNKMDMLEEGVAVESALRGVLSTLEGLEDAAEEDDDDDVHTDSMEASISTLRPDGDSSTSQPVPLSSSSSFTSKHHDKYHNGTLTTTRTTLTIYHTPSTSFYSAPSSFDEAETPVQQHSHALSESPTQQHRPSHSGKRAQSYHTLGQDDDDMTTADWATARGSMWSRSDLSEGEGSDTEDYRLAAEHHTPARNPGMLRRPSRSRSTSGETVTPALFLERSRSRGSGNEHWGGANGEQHTHKPVSSWSSSLFHRPSPSSSHLPTPSSFHPHPSSSSQPHPDPRQPPPASSSSRSQGPLFFTSAKTPTNITPLFTYVARLSVLKAQREELKAERAEREMAFADSQGTLRNHGQGMWSSGGGGWPGGGGGNGNGRGGVGGNGNGRGGGGANWYNGGNGYDTGGGRIAGRARASVVRLGEMVGGDVGGGKCC